LRIGGAIECQPFQASSCVSQSRLVAIVLLTWSMFWQLSGPAGHHLPAPYIEVSFVSSAASSARFSGSAGAGAERLSSSSLNMRAESGDIGLPSKALASAM
jgi:hypothetical protein